jgi:hypothetical protein
MMKVFPKIKPRRLQHDFSGILIGGGTACSNLQRLCVTFPNTPTSPLLPDIPAVREPGFVDGSFFELLAIEGTLEELIVLGKAPGWTMAIGKLLKRSPLLIRLVVPDFVDVSIPFWSSVVL